MSNEVINFMAEAVKEAEKSLALMEVPVGAVVVKNNQVVGRGGNKVEKDRCQVYHAEVLAIQQACRYLGNWRLNDASLYVTLEPCLMCYGLMVLSRIRTCFFIAHQPRFGVSCFLKSFDIEFIQVEDKFNYLEKLKLFFKDLRNN